MFIGKKNIYSGVERSNEENFNVGYFRLILVLLILGGLCVGDKEGVFLLYF